MTADDDDDDDTKGGDDSAASLSMIGVLFAMIFGALNM